MQIQVNNLDGSMKSIEQQGPMDTPQMLIDHAVSRSADSPGYIIIIGENLEDSPTREIANIIARDGELIWQNVLDS